MTYAEEPRRQSAHPTVITIKSGVKRDGTIIARKMRALHQRRLRRAQVECLAGDRHCCRSQYRITRTLSS
jgi:hypothetical protein